MKFLPLALLASMLLLTGCTSVPVETVVAHETMTGGENVARPDTITGVIREGYVTTRSERTNRVPLILGDGLSVRFFFLDPAHAPEEVRLKVTYPAMRSPHLGLVSQPVDRMEPVYLEDGRPAVEFNYGFDAAWELVPGHWHIEIWDGRRKLAAADLDTYLPEPGGAASAGIVGTGSTP